MWIKSINIYFIEIKTGKNLNIYVLIHSKIITNSYVNISNSGLPWWFRWPKNLPEMQETRVQSLGQENPLSKGNGYPL